MSPCDPIWGPNRQPMGFICSRGPRKGPKTPCRFCGALGAPLLCDGPGATPKKTCDAPMCPKCAVSVRSLDSDFCPRCAASSPPSPCPAGVGVRADPCAGPIVKAEGTCLKHAFLFQHWLRDGGWERVYKREDLTREQKRLAFRTWLATEDGQARVEMFAARIGREVGQ